MYPSAGSTQNCTFTESDASMHEAPEEKLGHRPPGIELYSLYTWHESEMQVACHRSD